MAEESPNPNNDSAMAELHRFIGEWAKRHGFSGAKEAHYLALYQAGRLEVQVLLEKSKAWKADDEPEEMTDVSDDYHHPGIQ